jgi:hypothetical protein
MVSFPKAKYSVLHENIEKQKHEQKAKWAELDSNIQKFVGGK